MRDIDTGMTPEQAADLAALTAGAAEPVQDAAQQQAQQAANEPQPPSAAALQIAAMAVGMLRPLLCYAVPSLKNAPDELWAPIPEGLGAVLDQYGASAEWMSTPWARLAISITPLAAFAAVEAMAAAKEKPTKTLTAPNEAAMMAAPVTDGAPAVPGAKTVTFGAVAA